MEYDEVLQDIFYIPRILGTFPFDSQFRISKNLMAYCCLVRVLSAFGVVVNYSYGSTSFPEEERTLSFALKSITVISVFGDFFFTLVWWFVKRQRISFLMESINDIQRRKKITLERQRIRFIHYLLFFTSITSISCYYTYNKKENFVDILKEISLFLNACTTVCFLGQFWDILHLLGHLFRESTQLYDESSVLSYERFLTLTEMVNEIYGSLVLFTITEYFLEIMISAATTYLVIVLQYSSDNHRTTNSTTVSP
ncbi:unnamed protein product [Nezara viridula]|uniref:Uncharacterized protein n=1 Tax=Nezara viridula TaxID=85310 RepID=A0A9P0HQ09_NEZVI|nr:unnamed protein product [Nezara viridula]